MRLKKLLMQEKSEMEKLRQVFMAVAGDLPGVKFHPRKVGNTYKYYIVADGSDKEQYLRWNEHGELIRRLLARRNAEEKIKMVEENFTVLDAFLRKYHFRDEWMPEEDYESISARGKRHLPKSQNPFRRHELIHDTGLGFFVRSKSEVIIARRLYSYGYYFEYERKLRMKGHDGRWKNIYPDFTIWLDDGRVIYLEHAGKFHEEEYRERFLEKMSDYHAADILISRDLFVTMDGKQGDISVKTIDDLIRSWLVI